MTGSDTRSTWILQNNNRSINQIPCPVWRCGGFIFIPYTIFADPVVQVFSKCFDVAVGYHVAVSVKVIPFFFDLPPAAGRVGLIFVYKTPFISSFFPVSIVAVPCVLYRKDVRLRTGRPAAVLAAVGAYGADRKDIGAGIVDIVGKIIGGSFGGDSYKGFSVFFQADFIAVTSFDIVPYGIFPLQDRSVILGSWPPMRDK